MVSKKDVCGKFEYRDGELYFKEEQQNQYKKGDLAGGINCTGYKTVRVFRKRYLLHRIVFLMHHGYLPKYIDHIDGDRLNNRIENLREATFSQNRQNTLKYKNNTSGVKGVCWNKQAKKWKASVQTNGKRAFLGYFKSIDDARDAVLKHRNLAHGEFANEG